MKTSYETSVVAETWVDSELVNPEEVTVQIVETQRAENWTEISPTLTDWVEETKNEQSVIADEQPMTFYQHLEESMMIDGQPIILDKQMTSNEQLLVLNEQLVTSDEQLVKSIEQLVTSNEQLVKMNEQPVKMNEQLMTSNEQLVTSDEQPVKSNKQLVTSSEQPVKLNKQLMSLDELPVKSNEQLVTSNEQPVTSNEQTQMVHNQLMTTNKQLTSLNEQPVSEEQPAAQCDPNSEYYTASSDVSILSDLEMAERGQDDSVEKEGKECVMAGHVAAMRERFESMTRANTPCPELARSLSPSLELFRTTPSPDGLG